MESCSQPKLQATVTTWRGANTEACKKDYTEACKSKALQHEVDPTQTAFVPSRGIGDNVLCHLEEVEYLKQTGQPGCMVFLDFSKASMGANSDDDEHVRD